MSGTMTYDMIVVGGGSGGIACAKSAAKMGKRVAICDFVDPSPHGTAWGFGGTCVNVGCIPKKLMHHAALIGEDAATASAFGWSFIKGDHTWSALVNSVQNYISSLNFHYRTECMEHSIRYINARANFKDKSTLTWIDNQNMTTEIKGSNIVIATGARPRLLDIEGMNHAVTSDDIFSLEKSPGKTLVIGASYIGLECAGFLNGLGCDVTVAVRSIALRGFDQEMVNLVLKDMETKGISFLRETVVERILIDDCDRKKVEMKTGNVIFNQTFDTVLVAVGRIPNTRGIGLESIKVNLNADGKVQTTNGATNVDGIFAIGDASQDTNNPYTWTELTPLAIKSGQMLAALIFSDRQETIDFRLVPTCVFTPLEYASVGLTEEAAIQSHGFDGVDVYKSHFRPLEWSLPAMQSCSDRTSGMKIICERTTGKVIGFHICAPHAGEITQGLSIAIKCGLTKKALDSSVGIHPTIAEEMLRLESTKSAPKRMRGC